MKISALHTFISLAVACASSTDKVLLRGKGRQLAPGNCPKNKPDCNGSSTPIPCGSVTCDPNSDTPFCYDNLGEGWEPRCGCENDDHCSGSLNGPSCVDTFTTGLKLCGCNPVPNPNGSYDGCDKNGEQSYCGPAYTETGNACQCDSNSCDGTGETCGAPSCIPDVTPYCSVNHDGDFGCDNIVKDGPV